MNAKQGAAIATVALLIFVALIASKYAFPSAAPSGDVVYAEPASALHTSLLKTASDGTIAVRLNSISDASNPATTSAWIKFSREAQIGGIYNFSLTPPAGAGYLVANVTVSNVQHSQVPFTYANFVLVSRDGTAYYANYAVCGTNCSTTALKSRALNGDFSSDLYVLFSVPSGADVAKLVYTASHPPIVMSLA